MMITKLGLLFTLTFAALSVTPESQSTDNVAKRLVGAWRLISYTQRLADGSRRQSPLSVGQIIYTDNNQMCAVLMDPSRLKWMQPGPYASPSNELEALSAVQGSDAYCGRVELHVQEGFVLHHVEETVRPNLIGATRKRWFTFDGPNRLVLRIEPSELPAGIVEGILTWERIGK
jgi:hypothetical protein